VRLRWGAVVALVMVATVLAACPSAFARPGLRLRAKGGPKPSPPQYRITIYVGLDRPEAAARAAFFAVGQPGSATYRRFDTVAQISRQYGASVSTRRAFERAIHRHGLTAALDPSGVFARVRGTVGRLDRAFGLRIRLTYDNDEVANVWFASGRPHPAADLRGSVREIVPTFNRSGPPVPGATSSNDTLSPAVVSASQPRNTGTWVHGCAAARKTHGFSYAQVRHAYGIDQLGAGQGASVAIMNVTEAVEPSDIAAAAKCFGYPKLQTRTLRTDGQSGHFHPPGGNEIEPEEDLALAQGMSPRLRSVTFTDVWNAEELWFLGVDQVLRARPRPDVLSISYGYCEAQIRGRHAINRSVRAGADLMDSMLIRLGLTGTSAFAAAGDFGSTCNGARFRGVTWPASSPYLTAVGGSHLVLNRANQRVRETVWNDLRWLPISKGGGAAGGGYSAVSRRPPYQRGFSFPGRNRLVPDISAQASRFPGFPVYAEGSWYQAQGTSAATPLVASAFASLDADQQLAGRPLLGPVNGLLYYDREHAPSALYDITSGRTRYLSAVKPRYATPGYDLASGLGVVQFDNLARALPSPARPINGRDISVTGHGFG
jgi:subtilase family serine protease